MAYTKISANCHAVIGVGKMDEVRAAMVAEGRSVILVMEGGAEAIKCKDAHPGAVVVHRYHGVHGDANWEHMRAWGGPEAYLNEARKACNDTRIVFQFLNESGIRHAEDKSGEIPLNVQCALAGLEYAHKIGQPIAINMDGTGGPDDTEVELMVPLIQRMNEINAERGYDFAYLMMHEYYVQHDPRFDGWREGRFQNHDPMKCEGDPANMLHYNNWYVGRYARVMYILRNTFGMECPKIIIGEWGADDVISQYHGAWPPDWKDYWLSEEAYAGHLTWLSDNVYDPRDPSNPYYKHAKNVVGMCIFSYGNSGGWEGCDYSQKGVFKGLLRDYALDREPLQEDDPMPDQNDPVFEDYVVITGLLNIRDAPGGNDTGDLVKGDVVQVDSANTVLLNGYVWGKHAAGWSALRDYGTVVYMERVVVEPDSEPDAGPVMTTEQWITMLQSFATMFNDVEDAAAKLKDSAAIVRGMLEEQIEDIE